MNQALLSKQFHFHAPEYCTRYYLGRAQLCDGDYKQAAEQLSWAFSHCPCFARKNKRRILLYLIPLRILLVCPFHFSLLLPLLPYFQIFLNALNTR